MQVLKKDTIIIGAGAAGLFCAIEAGKRGRSVLVLERNDEIGKKILISGGGRCNFTNYTSQPDNFLSDNPHFAKSAFARYTPQDFIKLVEKHDIKYHEKKLGQLFCDDSSREIVAMLESECRDVGVEIQTGCNVFEIKKEEEFILDTNQGEFRSQSLVIATGGLSIPKIGATNFGYRIAKEFGLKVTTLEPGLVPFLFQESDAEIFSALSGVSIDARVSCNGTSFRENILFTHRGLSGPAILQISSYWYNGNAITIDLLPEINIQEILLSNRKNKIHLVTVLAQYLPKRFVDGWCALYAQSRPMNQYNEKELKKISEDLHAWRIVPHDTEGFGKAEVTRGGVDTTELSSKTMEVARVPGLYFIGEVVDVTGWLGGYNFQWAWASGFVAGQYV